jgi:hypothetical protein
LIDQKKKINKREIIDKNSRYYALMLLEKGIDQQIDYWSVNKEVREITAKNLISVTEHQIILWRTLIQLCKDPDNDAYQRAMWDLLVGFPGFEMPVVKVSPSHLTLGTINICWKMIKDFAQSQLVDWNKHKQVSEQYYELGDIEIKNLWRGWQQHESGKLLCLREQIKHRLKLKKKKVGRC